MMIFLAEWAVRSSILIAVAALLVGALRVKDSAARLAAWIAALCASLAIPALMAAVPSIPLIVLRAAPAPTLVMQQMPAVSVAPAAGPIPAPGPIHVVVPTLKAPAAKAPAPKPFDWALAASALYCAIALVLLMRLLAGIAISLRILRRAAPLEIAGVRESAAVAAPVTLGILHPSIVLPAGWRDWDASKLAAVLAHERSHIERRDPLVQLLSSLHQAALWFSPFSWYLHRRIVRAAEEASDDAAVAATHDRTRYAEILLDFMRHGVRARVHGIAMARYGDPARRIDRVLDGIGSRGLTRSGVALILALALPLTAVIAAAQPQRAPQAPVAPPAQAAPLAVPAPAAPPAVPVPQAPLATPAPAAIAAPVAPDDLAAEPAEPAEPVEQPPAPRSQSGDSIRSYIVSNDDSMSMGSWSSNRNPNPQDLRAKYGRHFAWFTLGDREYVITDPGVMNELKEAMEPQQDVNSLQRDVNAGQSKVNDLQHGVNLQQNEANTIQREVNLLQDMVNRLQSAVNNGSSDEVLRQLENALKQLRAQKDAATQADVRRAQDKVNDAQARVNDEQRKVNALQAKVNDAQRAANLKIRDQLYEIFQSAIDRNLARRVN